MNLNRSNKQIALGVLVVAILLFGLVSLIKGQMTNPTAEDEFPQIEITQDSWEEWFFMARLEIGGQAYLFIDNFARTDLGPNLLITQDGNTVILSQEGIEGRLQPPYIHIKH